MSRCEIDDGCGNEKGRDAARSALDEFEVLALDRAEPADPGRNEDADLVGDVFGDFQARVLDGKVRGRQRELNEDVHLLDVFLFDEVQRIEAFDLTRDARGKIRRIEMGNRPNSAMTGTE